MAINDGPFLLMGTLSVNKFNSLLIPIFLVTFYEQNS